jgi:hypothetical protein
MVDFREDSRKALTVANARNRARKLFLKAFDREKSALADEK